MSEGTLPTTTIEGHEIGRLVIGTNWFLGYSHQSAAKSRWIRRYQNPERIANVLEICTAGGMNAIVAPIDDMLIEAMKTKQTLDVRHVERLRSLLQEFGESYFGSAKERPHGDTGRPH